MAKTFQILTLNKIAAIGLDRFGVSAPGEVVMEKLGFTVAHIVEVAQGLLRA